MAQVVRNLMIRAGADFSAITTQAKKASKSMRDMQSSVSRSSAAMTKALSGLKKAMAAVGIAASVSAIVSASREAAEAYDAQAEAEMKLATVMRNTMRASNDEIQSILDLASAQQKLGVVGDEVQLAGAQELATYLTETRTLKKLIPVMNDMAAQQYGYNVTAEETTSIATMLGKVMNGQVSALSRYGYTFNDAQANILKTGNEMQRAATLAQVVRQSVGGMNRALAATPTGRMIQLNNVLGDIREKYGQLVRTVGTLLLPLLYRVADILDRIVTLANRAANSIARVFGNTAALSGWKSITTGILPVADATEEVSGGMENITASAKEAQRTLAGFDDLNVLGGSADADSYSIGDGYAGSGSYGGGALPEGTGLEGEIEGLTDGFEEVEGLGGKFEKILQSIKDHMGLVKDTALAIGAGLAGWKIARSLGAGLMKSLGIASSLYGATQLVKGGFKAWTQGVDMDNLWQMLHGTLALTAGLGMAFNSLKAGAVGLSVGGFAMLATGMKDWIKTGELTNNAFLSMEGGIALLGGGLSILTGSWIPLAVAAVADLGLAVYHHWDTIKEALGSAWTWVTEGFNEFIGEISILGQGMIGILGELWDGIWTGLQTAWAWITEGVMTFVGELNILWQQMLLFVQEIWTALQMTTLQVWEIVKNFFSTAWTVMKDAAINAAATIKTTVLAAWNEVSSWTTSVFTSIKAFITTAFNTIKTTMTTTVNAAKATVTATWNALLANCRAIFQGISSTVVSIMTQILGFLQGNIGQWYSCGVALMQGFWNGLRSLMSAIWQSVVDFVNRCVQAVRSALRIGSPSKVFEYFGEMMVAGLQVGIDASAKGAISDAEGLANSLAAAVSPAALSTEGIAAGYRVNMGDLPETASDNSEAALYSIIDLLGDVIQAIQEQGSPVLDGDAIFQAVVKRNNAAINRTGRSPIRV